LGPLVTSKQIYGRVYAYFSAYKKTNGYNRYYAYYFGAGLGHLSDCNTLGVWPYAQSLGNVPVYQAPNSFQIICSGPDGIFGSGSNPTLVPPPLWAPNNAGTMGQFGDDDRSNFHDKALGSGS
jgi:hypothetical protein